MPKITVVIPCYRVEQYLSDCLDSILEQTYGGWEAICVDDGSPDRCGEILDEYAKRDRRFRIIHQMNAGVSAARNAGINVASGEWLYFLDGDDILDENALMCSVKAIGKFPNAEAVHGCVQEFTKVPDCNSSLVDERRFRMKDIRSFIDYETHEWGIWGFCFKRTAIEGVRFEETIRFGMGEDTVFVKRMIDKMKYVVDVDAVFYWYRQRDGSAMHSVITAEKRAHLYDGYRLRMAIISESKKGYARAARRWLGFLMTEQTAYAHFVRMNSEERRKHWELWHSLLRDARRYAIFIPWTSFVIQVCALLRSRVVTTILCYWPFWLKVHVYNRGRK